MMMVGLQKRNILDSNSRQSSWLILVLLLFVLIFNLLGEEISFEKIKPVSVLSQVKKPQQAFEHVKGLGTRPHSYRISQCECLVRVEFSVSCVSPGSSDGNVTALRGNFYPFVPDEAYDLIPPNNDHIRLKEVGSGLSMGAKLLLQGHYDNRTNLCKGQGTNSTPKIAFVHMEKPQVIFGIYHQFLTGLLPIMSFILGVCDGSGSVPVDSEYFDPSKIN